MTMAEAGDKAAAEEIEGKPAGAVKKVKVLVRHQYIDFLLVHPPRLRPHRRLDQLFQHPVESQAELKFCKAFSKLEANWKVSKDDYDQDMAILEEYRRNGCAYGEIEVDDCDEVVMTEGN